jgi:hypothetical protein
MGQASRQDDIVNYEVNYGSLFFIKQTALQMQTHRGEKRQGADPSEESGTEKHYFSLTTLAIYV